MVDYFTADTHFGHSGIIRLAKRPFRSVEEMDGALIEAWNDRVGPEDRVFHLGDFCFKGSKRAQSVLERLQGRIVFLKGNHDTENTAKLPRWESVHDILEVTVEGARLVLCHYPLLEWPGAWRGALHLHGHTHGAIAPNQGRGDVGVDVWGYRPVRLEEIKARLEGATPFHPSDNYAFRAGD
ncbi:MAG: metallophosphoesterase [Pseudomonadota bacterium]